MNCIEQECLTQILQELRDTGRNDDRWSPTYNGSTYDVSTL